MPPDPTAPDPTAPDATAPPAMAPPDTPAALRDRLLAMSDSLPRRLRQCAEYVAANLDRIAVSTVADMAEGAGVQPSAMMRFAQAVGFSGYSEMQRMVRAAHAGPRPAYDARLRSLRARGAGSPPALLAEFVDAGRHSLEALLRSVEAGALERAAAAIATARLVHVVGMRRAFAPAAQLAYSFEKMGVPALLHAGTAGLDARAAIAPGDVVVAISFAPYSSATVELATAAVDAGATLIAITDDGLSPLRKLGALVLAVNESDYGDFRPLAATMTLTLALAVAAGSARGG